MPHTHSTNDTGRVPNPQDIAHRLAIEDVLFKHSRGVDRADATLLASAYWPDAEVAYGSFNGLAHEFCPMLAAGIIRFRATHHQVSNIVIERIDHNAVVESYVTAYHYLPGEAGQPDTEMTYVGRYVDHMQLRDDCWKILMRHVVMDWNQNMTASADFSGPTFANLATSGRKPDDPLYTLLNQLTGA